MADEPLTVCPECQGTIRRVLFPAGIVFKGSGFYKTDHGSGAVVSENAANNANGNGHKENTNKENETKTESTSEKSKTSAEKTGSSASSGSESKVSAAAD